MEDWKFKAEAINSNTIKHQIYIDNEIMSFNMWIEKIQNSDSFINFYNQILIDCAFEAFFWEVKPLILKNLNAPFEFVLVNSNALTKIQSNPTSFQSYFNKNKNVVSFENIGGDAQLVAPTPINNETSYAHIAEFVRSANNSQIIDFWKKVGEVYANSIGENNTWLSTSGLGVYWLHVRVDTIPKYYQYLAYKKLQ